MSAGAVYFWIPDTFDPSAGGHVMKIGLSTNPIGRARDIQSTSPLDEATG